jgi:hypothetical protein
MTSGKKEACAIIPIAHFLYSGDFFAEYTTYNLDMKSFLILGIAASLLAPPPCFSTDLRS